MFNKDPPDLVIKYGEPDMYWVEILKLKNELVSALW